MSLRTLFYQYNRRILKSSILALPMTLPFALPALSHGQPGTAETGNEQETTTLPPVRISGNELRADGQLPEYAGGQVARGANLGILGNVDYMKTPFSQTGYTEEYMEDSQAQTLSQVLESNPSVRRIGGRFSSQDLFTVRGISVSGVNSTYDGFYGLGTFRRNSLQEITRVELLKGPSALLNGVPPDGGVGGTINLVPKRATATPVTDLHLKYASESIFEGHLDVGRRFGPREVFGVRVNAAHSDGDTPFDNNTETLSLLSVALDYIGKDLRLFANLNYEDQEQNASGFVGSFLAPGVPVPDAPDAGTNLIAPFTKTSTERSYNLVRGEYDFSDNWMGELGYAWQTSEELQYIHFSTQILNADGDYAEPSFYRLRNGDYDYESAIARLTGNFETGAIGHTVAISGYALERDIDSLTQNAFGDDVGDGIFNIYNPNVDAYVEPDFSDIDPSRAHFELLQHGVAVSDTLSVLDDRLRVTLGVRQQRLKNTNVLTNVVAYDESALTPAVAPIYQATETLAVYGNYIEGLSQAPSPPSTAVNADEVFDPAETKQWEVGVKMDRGALGGTLALFEITEPSGVTDPVTNVFSLDGEQRNRGVELEAFGVPVEGVRILGGTALIDAELVKTQDGTNDGNTASGTPELRVNLSGEWDTPFIRGLTLIGQAIYTDEQYIDNENTLKIPDWTRLDVGARYPVHFIDRNVILRMRVTNVLDKDYWETSGLVLGEPRSLSLSATIPL